MNTVYLQVHDSSTKVKTNHTYQNNDADYAPHKPVAVRVHDTLDTFLGSGTWFGRGCVCIRCGGNSLSTFCRSFLFFPGGLPLVALRSGIPMVTRALKNPYIYTSGTRMTASVLK